MSDPFQEALELLSDKPVTPAAPAAPPAFVGPQLPDLADELPALNNRESSLAAKRQRDQIVADADLQLASANLGQPLPITPDFEPPDVGVRDWLYRWSQGRLRLPSGGDHTLDLQASISATTYLQEHPEARAVVTENPALLKRFFNHVRALEYLNTLPATSDERFEAEDLLKNAWDASFAAGKISPRPAPMPAGATFGAAPQADYAPFKNWNPSAVTPEATRALLLKLQGQDGSKGLPSDFFSASERTTFDALGGWDFVNYVRQNRHGLVAENRFRKLLGHGSRDGKTAYSIQLTGAQDPGAFNPLRPRFDLLTDASPFARAVVLRDTEAAAQEAERKAAVFQLAKSRGITPSDAQLFDWLTNAGDVRSIPPMVASELFGTVIPKVFEYGTAGILPSAFGLAAQAVENIGESGSRAFNYLTGNAAAHDTLSLRRMWKQGLASYGRWSAAGKDNQQLLDQLYGAFPNIPAEHRLELDSHLFNSAQIVRDTTAGASAIAKPVWGLNAMVNGLLGWDNPAVRAHWADFAENTLALEDPYTFALQLAGFAAFGKALTKPLAGAERLYAKARLKFAPPKILSAAEEVALREGPAYLSVSQHAVLVDRLHGHLSSLQDRRLAADIAGRLEDTLAADPNRLGLDAQTYGATVAAIDRVKAIRGHLPAEPLPPPVSDALATLTKPISHLNFFDQAFTLSGDVNRARSTALVGAAENYLKAQPHTTQPLAPPPRLSRAIDTTNALLKAAEREADFLRQKGRILDITEQLEPQLDHEIQALELQADHNSQLARTTAENWTNFVVESTDRFLKLEEGGGVVPVAKRVVNSSPFKKLQEVLRLGDRDRLLNLANDQEVIRAIQNPEWRQGWDELRAELDRARGKPAVPESTAAAHHQLLETSLRRKVSLEGEYAILQRKIQTLSEATDAAIQQVTSRFKAQAQDLQAAAERQIKAAPERAKELNQRLADQLDELRREERLELTRVRTGITQAKLDQIPPELVTKYSNTLDLLDSAKRSLKSLKEEARTAPERARNPEIGFVESQIKAHEARLQAVRDEIRGRTGSDIPDSVADFLHLRAAQGQLRTVEGRLAKISEQVQLAQEAVATAEARSAAAPRRESQILDDMHSALKERADAFVADALTPELRQVLPATKPRIALAEGIIKRVETLAEGDVIRLTKEELSALNEYRSSPIEQPGSDMATALAKRAANLREQLKSSRAVRDDLRTFRNRVAKVTDPHKLTKVEISKELHEQLKTRLDRFKPETRRKLLRAEKGRRVKPPAFLADEYLALGSDLQGAELTAAEALDEALRGYGEEHVLLREGVQRMSSFEMAVLGQSRAGRVRLNQLLNEGAENAAGYQNWTRYEAFKWEKQLGRRLSDVERQQLLRDIQSGKPSNDTSLILMQKMRRSLLDRMLRIGAISPEFFHQLLGQDYYHGVYSRELRNQIQEAQSLSDRGLRLPGRFKPLMVDSNEFKFAIPEKEGTFYVTYRPRGGKIGHQADFKSWQEAANWADKNLPDGAEVSILKAQTFSEKTINGLVGDIGISHVTVMEKLAHQISAHQLTSLIEKSGLTRADADFAAQLADNPNASLIHDGGYRWHRVRNSHLPHFTNKWVREDGLLWLEETFVGYSYLNDVLHAVDSALPLEGRSLSSALNTIKWVPKSLGTASRTYRNSLAISKIALSMRAYVQAWMGNLFYSWASGIPMSPSGMYHRFAGITEYARLRSSLKSNLYLDGLFQRGSILPDTWTATLSTRGGFDAFVRDVTAKHWEGIQGLEGRIRYAESQILEASRKGNLDLERQFQAHKIDLENKLHAATKSLHSDFVRGGLQTVADNLVDGLQGLSGNRASKNIGKIWHAYQEISGDNATKYAVVKYLVEQKGFDLNSALDHVEAFTQHLHRVPSILKKATNTFGGAQFVSFPVEQARILWNLCKYYPRRALKMAGAITAWNTGTLASQGIDPDEIFEVFAAENGYARSPATDFLALMRGIAVPVGRDSERAITWQSTGPFLYDFLRPQSSLGRSLNRLMRAPPGQGGLGDVGISTAVGVATKFLGSEPVFTTFLQIAQGVDDRGDPLHSPWDVLGSVYRTATPDLAPGGRDFNTFSKLFSGTNVDPRTHREIGWLEYLGRRLFQMERSGGDDQLLAAAISHARAGSAREAQHRAAEKFEEKLSTQIAQGARRPDGTIDREKALELGRTYHEEDTSFLPVPGGGQVDTPATRYHISEAVKRASKPTLISRFESMALDDQVAAYALFRSWTGDRSRDVARQLEQAIQQKLTRPNGAMENEGTYKNLINYTKAAVDSGKLTDSAVSRLNSWAAQAVTLPVQKFQK